MMTGEWPGLVGKAKSHWYAGCLLETPNTVTTSRTDSVLRRSSRSRSVTIEVPDLTKISVRPSPSLATIVGTIEWCTKGVLAWPSCACKGLRPVQAKLSGMATGKGIDQAHRRSPQFIRRSSSKKPMQRGDVAARTTGAPCRLVERRWRTDAPKELPGRTRRSPAAAPVGATNKAHPRNRSWRSWRRVGRSSEPIFAATASNRPPQKTRWGPLRQRSLLRVDIVRARAERDKGRPGPWRKKEANNPVVYTASSGATDNSDRWRAGVKLERLVSVRNAWNVRGFLKSRGSAQAVRAQEWRGNLWILVRMQNYTRRFQYALESFG